MKINDGDKYKFFGMDLYFNRTIKVLETYLKEQIHKCIYLFRETFDDTIVTTEARHFYNTKEEVEELPKGKF